MIKNKAKKLMTILLAAAIVLSGTEGTALRADAASAKGTVKLNKTQVSVKKGKKVTLKVVKKNVKKIVSAKWSSKDKKIATVSSKGRVTGKKAGRSTLITCRVKYKVSGSEKSKSKTLKCKVTVKKDSSQTAQPTQPVQPTQPAQTVQPTPPVQTAQPEQSEGPTPAAEAKTDRELYDLAVQDAAVAEEDEIKPLVSLTKEDPLVTWDDQNRVLLCTWHSYPGSYPEGEKVTISWGYVWTFTDKEIATYAGELKASEDARRRMRQLIAIDPDKKHSTVTALWVDPADVIRPAYQSDPARGDMTTSFPEGEEVDEAFRAWFDQNILDSYYYGSYPWTRLGYTYDWADNGEEYGLTEFLIKPGAEVEVAYTETTDEFLSRLCQ